MDCTQINFSLTIGAASFNSDAVISVPAQKFDLGASIFLASENTSGVFGSLFFSLQSSIETAMFHVRDGFESQESSVTATITRAERMGKSIGCVASNVAKASPMSAG